MSSNKLEIQLSFWTIAKVFLAFVVFLLIYYIKDILVLFFIVLLLVAAFRPLVDKWEKKIKRLPAVLLLLLLFLLVLTFLIYIIVPPLFQQLAAFINNLPDIVSRFGFLSHYKAEIVSGIKSMTNNADVITGRFVSLTASIVGIIAGILTVIVMTIYLLLDKDGLKKFVTTVVPVDSQEAVINLAKKMSMKVGEWFRGQLILSAIIAIVDTVGLLIIGVPYALALGVLSGVLEVIPAIGPIIAGAIAALVALTISPLKAIFVIALYIIVQQLENNLLVPKIMQKAVGLSPVVIILALLIGAKLFGIIGAIIAVPASALISVAVQDWSTIKSLKSEKWLKEPIKEKNSTIEKQDTNIA